MTEKTWKVGDKCWYLLLHQLFRTEVVAVDALTVLLLPPSGHSPFVRGIDRIFRTRKAAVLELATLDVAAYESKAKDSAWKAGRARDAAIADARKLEKAKKRLAALKAVGS